MADGMVVCLVHPGPRQMERMGVGGERWDRGQRGVDTREGKEFGAPGPGPRGARNVVWRVGRGRQFWGPPDSGSAGGCGGGVIPPPYPCGGRGGNLGHPGTRPTIPSPKLKF